MRLYDDIADDDTYDHDMLDQVAAELTLYPEVQ